MTTIKIHNAQTGEVIERDMNALELAQLSADKAAGDASKAAESKAETDKAAILAKLGLTAEEAAVLLG